MDAVDNIGGLQETVMTTALEQTSYFQQAAFEGRLYEGMAVADLFASDGLFVSRVNHRLLSILPPLVNKFSLDDGSDGKSVTPFLQFRQLSPSERGK